MRLARLFVVVLVGARFARASLLTWLHGDDDEPNKGDMVFRERSHVIYDQMREASMLLLAQQQILAAEEAAGGSMAARAQATRAGAAREREKKRNVVAGVLPSPAGSAGAEGAKAHIGGRRTAFGVPAGSAGAEGAKAHSGGRSTAFGVPAGPGMLSGSSLGVGGLDVQLEEIRRRVCIPLAAPADLLEDLGISPVRGLLLYGPPGCGKTLLARKLSAALTPRPPTVVSGPEILERFVGSSEANIRALFDNPPDVPGGGDAEQADAVTGRSCVDGVWQPIVRLYRTLPGPNRAKAQQLGRRWGPEQGSGWPGRRGWFVGCDREPSGGR